LVFPTQKSMYEHRKEDRGYGEQVVVSRKSLEQHHPETKGKEPSVIKATPTRKSRQFVVADADRIKALADELVKVQTREREIKQEMKELLR
jgi:hypothetical protein